MTAGSLQDERERCLDAGMDDYLTKPMRGHILQEALRRWVAEPSDAGAALVDERVLAELAELLAAYRDEARADLAQLEGAAGRDDLAVVSQIAHRLKGSSATIGVVGVARIAAELEVAAGARDATGRSRAGRGVGRRAARDRPGAARPQRRLQHRQGVGVACASGRQRREPLSRMRPALETNA
jgi:HPt (histidine-containing phosphotransfer) domain-containing protein